MKVLLDEMIDVRFRLLLPGHDIFSVDYMKWKGVKNGALLAVAAANGFQALITVDSGIQHQQNPTTLPLALLIIFAKGTDVDALTPFAGKVLDTLANAQPGRVHEIRP